MGRRELGVHFGSTTPSSIEQSTGAIVATRSQGTRIRAEHLFARYESLASPLPMRTPRAASISKPLRSQARITDREPRINQIRGTLGLGRGECLRSSPCRGRTFNSSS